MRVITYIVGSRNCLWHDPRKQFYFFIFIKRSFSIVYLNSREKKEKKRKIMHIIKVGAYNFNANHVIVSPFFISASMCRFRTKRNSRTSTKRNRNTEIYVDYILSHGKTLVFRMRISEYSEEKYSNTSCPCQYFDITMISSYAHACPRPNVPWKNDAFLFPSPLAVRTFFLLFLTIRLY